jgi:toxin ParE1/3/4
LDRCEALAEFPQRHALVPRYEHHGIRRCVHANYLIFYRIGTQQIDVIHILHGAQDYEALLFPSA